MEDRDIVLYNEKEIAGEKLETQAAENLAKAASYKSAGTSGGSGDVLSGAPEGEASPGAVRRMKVTGIMAALMATVLLIAMLVIPDREFSDKENRTLASLPSLSAGALASGRFSAGMDSYTADQFPLRDMWISLRTGAERLLGHYCINGVYIGADEYLLEDIKVQDGEALEKRLSSINGLARRVPGIPVFTMIIPNAASVLPEKLPPNAPVADQDAWLDSLYAGLDPGIRVIDVRKEFVEKKAEGMQLYYRTDHHWTTDAARAALSYAAPYLDMYDNSDQIYDCYAINNEFQGTLVSKTGCTYIRPDVIKACVFRPGCEITYLVENVEKGQTSASVFVPEKLDTTDKYAVFFGGNYPLLHITTTAPSGRKILIFKDSYANCFAPLLIPYYSEIFMVDARYCNEDIYAMIQENRIDQILFLYNASTFAEDSSIDGMLAVPEGPDRQS